MRSERSKATDVSKEVRVQVMERDHKRCVICGSGWALQIAHLIPRSLGGLGIPENLCVLCMECHMKSHQEAEFGRYAEAYMRRYLHRYYPEITDEDRKYRRFK